MSKLSLLIEYFNCCDWLLRRGREEQTETGIERGKGRQKINRQKPYDVSGSLRFTGLSGTGLIHHPTAQNNPATM